MLRQSIGCAVVVLCAFGQMGCNVAKGDEDETAASGGSCAVETPDQGVQSNDGTCEVLDSWDAPNIVTGAVADGKPRCYSIRLAENGNMAFQISDFAANSVAMSLYGVKKDDGLLSEDELLKALPSRDGNLIEQLLPPGEHFLRINGKGSYTLTASFTPHGGVVPAVDPSANPDEGASLLELSTPEKVSGYVGPLDAADVYRFDVNEASNVTIGFVDSLGGWAMTLYSATPDDGIFADSEVQGSALARNNAPTFEKMLPPGTYFIKVFGESIYTMVVSQTPAP